MRLPILAALTICMTFGTCLTTIGFGLAASLDADSDEVATLVAQAQHPDRHQRLEALLALEKRGAVEALDVIRVLRQEDDLRISQAAIRAEARLEKLAPTRPTGPVVVRLDGLQIDAELKDALVAALSEAGIAVGAGFAFTDAAPEGVDVGDKATPLRLSGHGRGKLLHLKVLTTEGRLLHHLTPIPLGTTTARGVAKRMKRWLGRPAAPASQRTPR